jgi:RES domain
MSGLACVCASGPLFRLARKPNPWDWPPWEYCTKANRWDDPTETYRVLYACSERRGTFLETLARFRPDPAVVAGLAQITGDDEGALPPGDVPASWVTNRAMGTANLAGWFADVGHSESLAHLQLAMSAKLISYNIKELDGSVIREARREFTQDVSLYVFRQADGEGSPSFTGIAYESRLGNDILNWAIFERPDQDPVRDAATTEISLDDPDFVATLTLFDLRLAHSR